MKNFLLLAGLAATSLALPSENYVVHERRGAEPVPWTKRSAVNGADRISVRIALKQNNVEAGADKLYDISNPQSESYGKHLTKQQITDLFAATPEHISSVKNWLLKAGIPEKAIVLSQSRTWITVTTSVSNLEKALHAKYNVYNSDFVQGDHIGTDEYSLPADVSAAVEYLIPGVNKAKLNSRATSGHATAAIKEPLRVLSAADLANVKANINITAGCDTVVTPQCIKAIYGIPPGKLSNTTNPMGIFESINDVFAQEDLDQFFKLAAPEIPQGTTPELDLINGATAPVAPEDAGGESDLDFQMAYPIIHPQGTVLFQVAGGGNDPIFEDFLDAIDGPFCKGDPEHAPYKMCGTFDPTSVISISYGGDEFGNDVGHLKRQCNEFMKLGLQGVTVVVSSGDDGVASTGGYCLGPHHDVFVPTDAAGCPYVTSVGSTLLPKGSKIGDPEVATTRFSSGGGFSNVFPRPSWQENAVGTYLLRHNPNYFAYNQTDGTIPTTGKGIYNRGGRAYPDVSALGDNGLVVIGGKVGLIGGTSMSAPIVGAIFNRINEERLNLGKGPIGFANPALYQAFDNPDLSLFTDVVTGNQALGGAFGSRYPSACGNDGFHCTPGYDPVTGLGTPKYAAWENYFLGL